MNKIAKRASYLLLGLGALAGLGAIYQALAEARDRRKYPPPGQLVDVGTHRLHIYSSGEGRPTVILEAGLNGTSIDWCKVQPQIAEFTRVCSYDRAGYGWSDPGPMPRTGQHIAQELHALLTKSKIEPPYVLVGHSYGGELVRVYADQYPEGVAGMVLVDSSHENQIERARQLMSWKARLLVDLNWKGWQLRPVLARLGILRLMREAYQDIEIFPPEMQPAAVALEQRSTAFDWTFGEASAIPACNAYLRTAKPLRDIPFTVITGAIPRNPDNPQQQVMQQAWIELQRDLATRSPRGKHIIAEQSGHIVQLDQPDLVVREIREIVEEVRTQSMSMPSQTKKDRVIADLVKARSRILDAPHSLPPEDQNRVFLGTWSAKDLLAHLVGWDLTNLQATQEILAGRLPGFYDRHDPDWKTYNAELVKRHQRDNFADLLASAKESHHNLIEFLKAIPADEFEKERRLHWQGHRVTLARLLEAEARDEQTHYAQMEKLRGGAN